MHIIQLLQDLFKSRIKCNGNEEPADILHQDDDIFDAAELQGGQPVGRAQLQWPRSVHPPHHLLHQQHDDHVDGVEVEGEAHLGGAKHGGGAHTSSQRHFSTFLGSCLGAKLAIWQKQIQTKFSKHLQKYLIKIDQN